MQKNKIQIKNSKSNLYLSGAPSGDNNRRNPNMDSHNRLFGEVERPYTPAKNHFKSSIPLGGADSVDSTPRTNGTNGKANGTNGHTNGNGHSNGGSNGEAMIANGNSVKHGELMTFFLWFSMWFQLN